MFNKRKSKIGDYRIEEKYIAESGCVQYRVEQYQSTCGYDCMIDEWVTRQRCSSMDKALKWVTEYKKEDNVKYHYL